MNWKHRYSDSYAEAGTCPGPEWEPYAGPMPQTPLDELRAAKIAEIKQAHDAFTGARAPEYGVTSRDTWATQEKTARDLHDGVITEEQAAPLLLLVAGRASTGGAALTATEQAGRIIRNADAWRALGLWTEGQRNGYCDQVDAVMATVSDDALAALPDDAARAATLEQARNALEAIVPVFSEPPV